MAETTADGEPARTGTSAERGNRRWWTAAVFAYIVLEGAGLQMRGAVVPELRRTFPVTDWQLGLVAPAGTLGFLVVVVLVGAVAGQFRTRRLLFLGVVGTGVGVLLMGLAPSFGLFLAALLGRGMLTGVARGTDRPLLSHLYPEARGRIFGYYDMMWAVGATAGPVLVAVAVSLGNWRLAYFALALAFVPVAALVWWLPAPEENGGDAPLDVAELRRIGRRPEVVAMALAVFLSTAVEGGLFTWLTTFAEGRLTGPLSTASLSVMLAAYVPGRLVSGQLSERFGYVRLSVGLAAVLIPALGYTFFFAEGLWLLVGFFAVGLTVSGLYPTLLAYGTEAVPEHSAPVNAMAAVTSAMGIAAAPAVMGFVIGDAGVAFAMQLLVVPAGLLLVLVVATDLLAGRASGS
ncbi:MFS transporter [Halomicroarcula sp. GCM10025817]|uniref:MFS transporter n=1 Tax=Halomicroarcula sp. GCM10025817 TaxID=3252672 RepID=UPI003615DA5E